MATAHFSIKTGKAGKGTPHAEYIARVGKYAQRLEQGEKLEMTESGNMPKWAQGNPILFWQAADQYERKNGYVYREHEIALPRELNAEQRAELVREWVAQELGEQHAYTWAIHNKTALDGGEQPHVHLMFSERMNDGIERDPEQYFKRYNAKYPERGGAKKHNVQGTATERKAALKEMRGRWEQMHNAHIDRHIPGNNLRNASRNHRAKISMKSLAEQGIERKAEPHMTPSESAAKHREVAARNAAAHDVRNVQVERAAAAYRAAQAAEQEAKRAEQERKAREAAERAEAAKQKAEQEQRALAAAEQQAKQAQETPKEPPKQEEHFIAKLPNDKLMTMYSLFQKQLDDMRGLERDIERGDWYINARYRMNDNRNKIRALEDDNKRLHHDYWAVQDQRENRFFGMGKIGAKLVKENEQQQHINERHGANVREIRRLKTENEELEGQYSDKLAADVVKVRDRFNEELDNVRREIGKRPLEDFRNVFLQAAQEAQTTIGQKAVQIELEKFPLNGSPSAKRIAFYFGGQRIREVEQKERESQRKEQERQARRMERDDGHGIGM